MLFANTVINVFTGVLDVTNCSSRVGLLLLLVGRSLPPYCLHHNKETYQGDDLF